MEDKNSSCPITEFYPDEGLISPSAAVPIDNVRLPSHIDTAVILFDRHRDEKLLEDCTIFYNFAAGSCSLPQYIYKNAIVLAFSPLGSAAAGGLMEELIAFGVKRFIACGSAGLIDPSVDSAKFLIVNEAIRDEGLSYHYLPAAETVKLDERLSALLRMKFDEAHLDYIEGMTWTTDGFYRETKERINRRRDQGAISVEMECAGFAAVAQFRKVRFAQILYFSDIVHQEVWSGFTEEKKLIKNKINHAIIEIALSI